MQPPWDGIAVILGISRCPGPTRVKSLVIPPQLSATHAHARMTLEKSFPLSSVYTRRPTGTRRPRPLLFLKLPRLIEPVGYPQFRICTSNSRQVQFFLVSLPIAQTISSRPPSFPSSSDSHLCLVK